MNKKRAMSSQQASKVKIAGHVKEHLFAQLIGGQVNRGSQTDKKDVLDQSHSFHSVKGGTWWQIFLYGRNRFLNNTIFKNIGNISNLMIECIDSFPSHYSEYQENKERYKLKLQEPMKALAVEFDDKNIKKAFFEKALFDGGQVNYLTIMPNNDENFYIFYKDEVVNCLADNLIVTNSKARNSNQYDNQKVLFKLDKNVGEIEIRVDSNKHYKQAKCRFNGTLIFNLLLEKILEHSHKADRVIACGRADKLFKTPRQ